MKVVAAQPLAEHLDPAPDMRRRFKQLGRDVAALMASARRGPLFAGRLYLQPIPSWIAIDPDVFPNRGEPSADPARARRPRLVTPCSAWTPYAF